MTWSAGLEVQNNQVRVWCLGGGGGVYGCVHVLVGGEKVYECKCEGLG